MVHRPAVGGSNLLGEVRQGHGMLDFSLSNGTQTCDNYMPAGLACH